MIFPQVLHASNVPQVAYPRDRCIHQQFVEQVDLTPSATAIDDVSGRFTYIDLQQRVRRLANALKAHEVRHGDRVALRLGRSVDFVIAALAVLSSTGLIWARSGWSTAPNRNKSHA